VTTTEDLRRLLPAEPNGAPTAPGWYVVESVHDFVAVAEIDKRGRLWVCGLESDLNDPDDIACHAPLAIATEKDVTQAERLREVEAQVRHPVAIRRD
jgi:hypothetical protein